MVEADLIFYIWKVQIQVNVPCVGSVPRGTGPMHKGSSAPFNKGTFSDVGKNKLMQFV